MQVSKSRPRGDEDDNYGPPDRGYWQPRFPGERHEPPGYPRGRFGYPPGPPPPPPPPPPRRPPYPERAPGSDRGVVDYYEKYRARPYGGASYEDCRAIPPPPPPPAAAIMRERLAGNGLDPYERRPLPPPQPHSTAGIAVQSDVLLQLLRHPQEMVIHTSVHVSPLSPCLVPRCTACLEPESPILTGCHLHLLRATLIKANPCAFITQGEDRMPCLATPQISSIGPFLIFKKFNAARSVRCARSNNVNFVSKIVIYMTVWSFKPLRIEVFGL